MTSFKHLTQICRRSKQVLQVDVGSMKPKKSSQKFHIIKFATLKNKSTQHFQALAPEKFSLKVKEPLVKQERCNDARWFFQHITSISQSGKTVDAGVNCLFFFSRVSLLPGQDLVFPMMFFCLVYETLQLHIIPLYLHSTSHAFVLTFKVSLFFHMFGVGLEVLYLHLSSGWVVLLWLQPVWSRLGRF